MSVKGFVPILMFHNDGSAMTAMVAGKQHASSPCGTNRRSDANRNIDPFVKNQFPAAEGIGTPSNPGRNGADYGQIKVSMCRKWNDEYDKDNGEDLPKTGHSVTLISWRLLARG
jgi:hypothetical protein